jgi:hypothetical protein
MTTAAPSSLTAAGQRQQGLDRSNSCPSIRLRRTTDSHDIMPAGCPDLSGCHIGMYLVLSYYPYYFINAQTYNSNMRHIIIFIIIILLFVLIHL